MTLPHTTLRYIVGGFFALMAIATATESAIGAILMALAVAMVVPTSARWIFARVGQDWAPKHRAGAGAGVLFVSLIALGACSDASEEVRPPTDLSAIADAGRLARYEASRDSIQESLRALLAEPGNEAEVIKVANWFGVAQDSELDRIKMQAQRQIGDREFALVERGLADGSLKELPSAPASDASTREPAPQFQRLVANLYPGQKLHLRSDRTYIGEVLDVVQRHRFPDGSSRPAVKILFGDGAVDWLPRKFVTDTYVTPAR